MAVINFEFRNKILKLNVSLSYCYQCSTCSGSCPVALLTNGEYNPRKIIEFAVFGLEDRLLNGANSSLWLCSTCQKCVELCPQKVELTEIFTQIKNLNFKSGRIPDAFISQGQSILENGVALPYSRAILSRREQLNLPEVNIASAKDLKPIFEATDFEKNILKGGEDHK